MGKYLLPTERVIICERRHWAVLTTPLTWVLAGFLVALILDTALPAGTLLRDLIWLAWLALLGYLVWRLVEWWYDRFLVTNKRVMLVYGVLMRNVAMMPLSKVTDMSYVRSLSARMLGYGVFVMESAGQDQALDRIDYVPRPDWLYREMCALLFGGEGPADGPEPGGGGDPADDPADGPAHGPSSGPGARPGPGSGPRRGAPESGFGPDEPDPDDPTASQTSPLPGDRSR